VSVTVSLVVLSKLTVAAGAAEKLIQMALRDRANLTALTYLESICL
jgi:hypothetical protein